MEDTLINFGSELKALGEIEGGKGRIGGYLVRWGNPDETDLVGDYFTAKTYLGAHDGNGADVMIHHGMPLKDRQGRVVDDLLWTRDVLLPPIKTHRDDVGLFAETICDMSDVWEAKVYDLAVKGKFKWSSGAAHHTVRRRDGKKSGEILRWPLVEGSLTPSPMEPRGTQVMSLKAYLESEAETPQDEKTPEIKTSHDFTTPDEVVFAVESILRSRMPLDWQAEAVRTAVKSLTARVESLSSLKGGSISADSYQAMQDVQDALCDLMTASAPRDAAQDTAQDDTATPEAIRQAMARYEIARARAAGVAV